MPRCRGGRLPLVLCGGWGRRLAGFSACGGRSRGGVRVPLHCDWRARAWPPQPWPPQPGFRPALPRCGVKPWLAASSTLGSWLCHRLLVRVPTLLSSVSGALAQGRVQTRIHTSLPAPPLVSMWHFLPFLIVSGVIFPTPTGRRRHRFPAESGPVPRRRLGLLQLACWPC